ncbi:MAG TPA: hypothetical protein PKK60_01035 [archaeon]|nr:hypothetical protein [archaeon]
MFKKALFLFFLILVLNSVFSLRLIGPVYTDLNGNDYVGSILPGSNLELTFSKQFDRYVSLELVSQLPSGFESKIVEEVDYSKILISSPKNAVLGKYPLTLEFIGEKESVVFQVYFLVEKDLLTVSSDNYFASSNVGEKAVYNFTFINNSHADVNFTIINELPWFWNSDSFFEQENVKVLVPSKSTKEGSLFIYPRKQGETIFNTTIFFDNSSESRSFSLRLNATPSIKGKTESVFFGLPFYSFSLMPNYLINGLFSLYFN